MEPVFHHLWVALVGWSLLYIGDYYATIFVAKRMREHLSAYIEFEGSVELTPQFQKDVDELRLVSRQFVARWLISLIILAALWWLAREARLWIVFDLPFGALTLRELAVHMRHWRNWATCHLASKGGLEGKIRYRRSFLLKISAAEFAGFGLLYLVLALGFPSWFLVGGALGCALTALQHWRLGQQG